MVPQSQLRVNYRHYTAVATDNFKYDPDRVISDLARLVMSRILSVQFGLQKFIVSRRHTSLKKVLPNSINKPDKLGGIGQINTHARGCSKSKKESKEFYKTKKCGETCTLPKSHEVILETQLTNDSRLSELRRGQWLVWRGTRRAQSKPINYQGQVAQSSLSIGRPAG